MRSREYSGAEYGIAAILVAQIPAFVVRQMQTSAPCARQLFVFVVGVTWQKVLHRTPRTPHAVIRYVARVLIEGFGQLLYHGGRRLSFQCVEVDRSSWRVFKL